MSTTKNTNRFQYVAIDKTEYAAFNPEARTTPSAILSLRKQIEKDGHIIRPLDVIQHGGKFHIADGHRRRTVAGWMGMSEVPVMLHDIPAGQTLESYLPKLWGKLNQNKVISAHNWAVAFFGSGDKVEMPSVIRQKLEKMIDIWGKAQAKRLVLEEGVSPSVVHCLGQVRVRLEAVPSVGTFTELEIGNWLIETKSQNAVNSILNGVKPDIKMMRKLASAIKYGEMFKPFEPAKRGRPRKVAS